MTDKPCFECGEPADCDHHVVPRSLGGTKTVPLCDRCHGLIHGKKARTRALTLEALRRRKGEGRLLGAVPLGFKLAADGKTLEVDEREAEAIRRARRLRKKGFSLRAIAAELERLGFLSRAGERFIPMQVKRMLVPSDREVLEVGEF